LYFNTFSPDLAGFSTDYPQSPLLTIIFLISLIWEDKRRAEACWLRCIYSQADPPPWDPCTHSCRKIDDRGKTGKNALAPRIAGSQLSPV